MSKTGIRPHISDVIKAKCFDCCGGYVDGYNDCKIKDCPLYIKMPYRHNNPNYMWVFDKWSSIHREKIKILNISKEEYIYKYIIKDNNVNKINIGNVKLFRAKCFRCYNNFIDKRQDCLINECPLYYWMPYREPENIPDLNWMFDLKYSRKHRVRRALEGLSREKYLEKYFSKKKLES